jgi:hypothetical protein
LSDEPERGLLASIASRFTNFLRGPSVRPVLSGTSSSLSSLVQIGAGFASRLMRSVVVTVSGPPYSPMRRRRTSVAAVSPGPADEVEEEIAESAEELQEGPGAMERASFPSLSRAAQTAFSHTMSTSRLPTVSLNGVSRSIAQEGSSMETSDTTTPGTSFQEQVARAAVSPTAAMLSFQSAATGVFFIASSVIQQGFLSSEGTVPGTAFTPAEAKNFPPLASEVARPAAGASDASLSPVVGTAFQESSTDAQPYYHEATGAVTVTSAGRAPSLFSSLLLWRSSSSSSESQAASSPGLSMGTGDPAGTVAPPGEALYSQAALPSSGGAGPSYSSQPTLARMTFESRSTPSATRSLASPTSSTSATTTRPSSVVSSPTSLPRPALAASPQTSLAVSLGAAAVLSTAVAAIGLDTSSGLVAGSSSPRGGVSLSLASSARRAAALQGDVVDSLAVPQFTSAQSATATPRDTSASSSGPSTSLESPHPPVPSSLPVPLLGGLWTEMVGRMTASQRLLTSALANPAAVLPAWSTAGSSSPTVPDSKVQSVQVGRMTTAGGSTPAPTATPVPSPHSTDVGIASASGASSPASTPPPSPPSRVASSSPVAYAGTSLTIADGQVSRRPDTFGILPGLQSAAAAIQSVLPIVDSRSPLSSSQAPSLRGSSTTTSSAQSAQSASLLFPSSSAGALPLSGSDNPGRVAVTGGQGGETDESEAASQARDTPDAPLGPLQENEVADRSFAGVSGLTPAPASSPASVSSSPPSPIARPPTPAHSGAAAVVPGLGRPTPTTPGRIWTSPTAQGQAPVVGAPVRAPSGPRVASLLEIPSIAETVSLASTLSLLSHSAARPTTYPRTAVRPRPAVTPQPYETNQTTTIKDQPEKGASEAELFEALDVASTGVAGEQEEEGQERDAPDTDLRRKIEALLREELRRYGIQ